MLLALRSRRRVASWGGVLTLTIAACARSTDAPIAAHDKLLGEGMVVRVGGASADAATVAAVAAAQAVSPTVAVDRITGDLLFAEHARAEPAWHDRVEAAERAVLARALLDRLRDEVNARPITDDDVRAAMAAQWREYDRPEAARTIHAVVRFSAPADQPRARAVAEAIRARVAAARDATEFRRLATAVPSDGFEVKVEELAPVAKDGRQVSGPPGNLVEAYARAANAIEAPGDTSPITRTEFGFHVIRLLERLPAHRVPLDVARDRLEPQLRGARLKHAEDQLLQQLAAHERPLVDRAADDLTGLVRQDQGGSADSSPPVGRP